MKLRYKPPDGGREPADRVRRRGRRGRRPPDRRLPLRLGGRRVRPAPPRLPVQGRRELGRRDRPGRVEPGARPLGLSPRIPRDGPQGPLPRRPLSGISGRSRCRGRTCDRRPSPVAGATSYATNGHFMAIFPGSIVAGSLEQGKPRRIAATRSNGFDAFDLRRWIVSDRALTARSRHGYNGCQRRTGGLRRAVTDAPRSRRR